MIHIIFLSSLDNFGGAAKATLKLYKSLSAYNLRLKMFVKKKLSEEKTIHRVFTFLPITVHLKFDKLILSTYGNENRNLWSLGILPNFFLFFKLRFTKHDILQLNWINGGFVPIRLLKYLKKPIVWRLSDSWAFTGGCHIPLNCYKYQTGCGACPQLGSHNPYDISYNTLLRKQKAWKKADLTIVAPSQWMADNATKSLLFRNKRIVHIPTGVDISLFTPLDFLATRNKLKFNPEKKLILFGAVDATADPNKGFHLLLQALHHLHDWHQDPNTLHLVVFGNTAKLDPSIILKFQVSFVGMINDNAVLNEYYNAADVYVLPSLLENSPNTVVEAMSAGTPVVAFDAGGTTELISHLNDGYLATPYSTQDLAKGILYLLNDISNARVMGTKARAKIENKYDINKVAGQYYQLYKDLIETRNQKRAD